MIAAIHGVRIDEWVAWTAYFSILVRINRSTTKKVVSERVR